MSIAERINQIMKEKNVSRYKLSKDTGIPYTTLTQILSGRTQNPQVGALRVIADYFEKPIDYFTDGEDQPYYKLNDKDERDIAEELNRLMADLESDSSLAFMGEPMDEEDRELLRISLENTLRMSKEMAKKKFTPKKFRN